VLRTIEIPYGKGTTTVVIEEDRIAAIVTPNDVPIADEVETIRHAVANPINAKTLREFLADARDVLFIVNDATRPTPTARVLDIIQDEIQNVNSKFIVATGIHRAPTEEEFRQIFGKHYEPLKSRIHVHDSKAEDQMVFLGTSKNGTEMYINRLGVEAHKIVIIGSVEPHYFAGYTGGRKSFLPGIASHKTITQNHRLALSPEARSLALEGNPVHEDMIDALSVVKKEIFAIMTVLDRHHRIYAATAGDIYDSFTAAIDKANDVFVVKIPEKADIVVSAVRFPMDIDLYQSQKGIDNGKLALKDQGILILVSKCRHGIGEESFVNLLSSCDSPAEVLEKLRKEYIVGYHKAGKMAEIGIWAQTWAVTDLEPELLERIFIKPFSSVQEAIDKALEEKGPEAKVIFMLDGSMTVPMA
jgi:nickel-dependent lactate racemase